MSYTIAVAGKGGTGKTTLAALILVHLLKAGRKPILAVDADPNSNLNEALGVEFDHTVVSTVDGIMEKKEDLPAGVTKERLLELHLEETLVEAKGFDLLIMGHTEGAGCYCHANNLLRNFMEKLKGNYSYVVMDNEAGMEHLSRRTTRDVDVLLITANSTPVALRAAQRIYETAEKLKLKVKKSFLVINEVVPNSSITPFANASSGALAKLGKVGLPLLGKIPYDEEVAGCSFNASPLLDLTLSSAALQAVGEMMGKL